MKNKSEFNASVSYQINIADGLAVRYIDDDPEIQRTQLVVVIDEYTDFDVINENRKTLKNLLKKLESSQGIDLNHPIKGNEYGFYQWQINGIGPKALTSILNYIGLALILYSHDQKQGRQSMDVYYEKEFQSPGLPFLSNASFAEQSFYKISLAAGLTIDDSILYINQGHRSFAQNRIPWKIKEGPFNEQKLESKVDYFRKKIDQKVITIAPVDSELNRLEYPVYWLNKEGYLKKINEILDKKGGESWKRSKLKIKTQIDKIIKNWETSENPLIVSLRKLSIK